MKAYYQNRLQKDFSTACCTWFLCAMLFAAITGGSFIGASLVGLFLAGIPFGWKFLTKVYPSMTALVVVKALLAILIGWVALPLILIGDILFCAVAEA